jgi:hypothetical protein
MRLLLLVFGCLASLARAADPQPVDAGWLVDELRKGGYLVFFRHTSTFRDTATLEMEARNVASGRLSLDDCSTQRLLNERGVIEAGRQAKVVTELAIPYGTVYASRYCRARDHVRWFTDRVTWSDALTPVRNADKAKELRQLLAAAPAPGTNALFFAHGGILWQATDYDSEEAETFVFRPGAPPVLVAAIKMSDWDALAQRKGMCCAPRTYWGGQGPPKE